MSGHPIPYERLIAYAGDELSPAAADVVAAHVAACAECAATVARYRMVGTTLRGDDGVAPPAATMARAKAIFARAAARPRRAEPLDLLAPLRRIVAQLSFDGRGGLGPALAGVRGGVDAYHLAYESEAAAIDVQVEPAIEPGTPRWRLIGQVALDEETTGIRVALAPAGEAATVAETEADEHGMFALVATAGTYDVLVRLPEALVVLPGLEIG